MTAEVCTWCGELAVTHVITRPGRAKRQTAPVCERHAADFEARGMPTVRLEVEEKARAALKRSQWARRS